MSTPPTRRISRNIILGAVHLSLGDSRGLVEKTNREGFVENDACKRLREIILGVLEEFEGHRFLDKSRMRQLAAPQGGLSSIGIDRLIDEALRRLEKLRIDDKTIGSCLRRIRRYHHEMQETLLSAGVSGLNLAVVFHEVERGVRTLHESMVRGADPKSLVGQARNLAQTLDGFSALLRRNSRDNNSAKRLIKAALRISSLRLKYHHIEVDSPILDCDQLEFQSRFAFNLVLGAVSNLIDNAIYWLRVRHPDAQSDTRKLYIGTSSDFEAGPAIVVADNGTGFQEDSMAYITRPFLTHKPDGMGLGLYYASLAMELQEGQLVFPRDGEVYVPEGFDGAVVALVFKGE